MMFRGILPKRRKRLILVAVALLYPLWLMWVNVSSFNTRESQSSEDPDYEAIPDDIRPGVGLRWSRYSPPAQSGVKEIGKEFLTEESHDVKWPIPNYVKLSQSTARKFVIATAGDQPFYTMAMSAIETVQRHLPDHEFIFYDLAETPGSEIAQKFKDLCGVRYRAFDFSRYPTHIRQLRNYAWKILIITDLLIEYPGVLWMDSSIRLNSNNVSFILQRAITNGGMLSLTSTGHSNFAVTHQQMYEYLPTSIEGMIKTDQHEANCVLLYRTRLATENVLWWWRSCALVPACIAPTLQNACSDPYKSRSEFARCHRFDQSALNILLANYFAYDYMRYFGSHQIVNVMRGHVTEMPVRVCKPGTEPYSVNVEKYVEGINLFG